MNIWRTQDGEEAGNAASPVVGRQLYVLDSLCSALVLWDGFAFVLWQLDGCLFGVGTRRDGDNNSNTVKEQTDHCPGSLLAGRW